MKKILIFLLALTSFLSTVNAAYLECEQFEGDWTQGFLVRALITADVNVKGPNDVELTNLRTSYDINYDDSSSDHWSKGDHTEESVSNYQAYRPRVYKNHMKFSYYVYSKQNYASGYGSLDLIVPTKAITSMYAQSFTSYLIMTYMDDHFGGTISLNCTLN